MEANDVTLNTLTGTTVIGTDDREALPKRWVAALVQIRSEKAVGKKLCDLHIENYVPTQLEYHQWSDRRKKVEKVIIPMVVFIHTDPTTEKQLIRYSFIHKLLSYPGERLPATIPDEQIGRLKFMLRQAESVVEMKDHILKAGEKVRIARGPLKGLEGELYYIKSDKPMVAVRIECLGYACVNVSRTDLELL